MVHLGNPNLRKKRPMPNPTGIERELHLRLINPTSTEFAIAYQQIPTLAAWRGDIAKAMSRLQQMRSAHQQLGQVAASIRWAWGGGFAMQQPSRIAGDLANATLVDAAIVRYQSGISRAGEPVTQLAKSIHGSLLVDIYTVTGQFMRSISRNTNLRTDNDCALLPLYRAVHYAAADVFGRVFGISGDQIDVYLREQLIFMSNHGVHVDHIVGNRKHDHNGTQVSQLCYLSDAGAMACRLSIADGKFKIINHAGELELFDCSGGEFMAPENSARNGEEANGKKGVAGFAMGLNRSIYAHKHTFPGDGNTKAGPASNFYHSSYLGGREVLCTGCITVVNGELTYINNFSGHYQPSVQQVSQAVQALRAQGVNIDKVVVEYFAGGKSVTQTAPEFLRDQTAEGMDFNAESKGRFVATARKIREALAAYEKRSKRWYAAPSQRSLEIMKRLMKILNDEQLVREVRFLLGEGTNEYGIPIKGKFAASPFNTNKEDVLAAGGGELFEQLSKATASNENY